MTDVTWNAGGSWLDDTPPSTGSAFGLRKTAKVLSCAMLVGMGTGASGAEAVASWPQFSDGRCGLAAYGTAADSTIPESAMSQVVSPTAQIERIRKVFSPPVAELAQVFGVTRQAVYNWLNGAPPTAQHLDKLADLARAAEIVEASGIPVSGWMMRRKMFNGKTLLAFVGAGGSAQDAANRLVQTVRKETEQRQRMDARLTGRKTAFRSPESDFPAENDAEG